MPVWAFKVPGCERDKATVVRNQAVFRCRPKRDITRSFQINRRPSFRRCRHHRRHHHRRHRHRRLHPSRRHRRTRRRRPSRRRHGLRVLRLPKMMLTKTQSCMSASKVLESPVSQELSLPRGCLLFRSGTRAKRTLQELACSEQLLKSTRYASYVSSNKPITKQLIRL
ncbi:hypothetical protein RA28_11960 [Ruegeria sp. ANG-S4]|nr:hypothetical protein RA28_11960 [Ruegeria sp. ANG-S4]